MSVFKQKISVLKAVASVTYKEWSAYRSHSMVSILVGPLYFLVQYFIWTSVYHGQTINGMDINDVLRYFGITALIGYLTMDFADWNLSMLIRTGKYLTFALRPVHHRFFALSQKIGHRILGFFFEFIPVLLIFVFVFKINMMPYNVFLSVISIALAFLMNFYVNYCLGLASFWIVESGGLRGVFSLISSMFSGALIPLVFFPKWFQKVQFFLPFQYITYVPAMVFTGKFQLAGENIALPLIVGIQAIAVLVVFFISEILYNAAIKRFTGVGA